MKRYSLKKAKSLLISSKARFKKKGSHLRPEESSLLEEQFKELGTLIVAKERKKVSESSVKLQKLLDLLLPRTWFEKIKHLLGALLFALIVATLIRTMWFELYEVPTGSMRPTFKEQDRLIASKTTYGINVPLLPHHFYFEPKLVKRGDIVIFTVENMAVHDPDTLYFGIFPGKRLLVKRLIGKPGDTLYFYGGKIYGIDSENNPLPLLQESSWGKSLVHVPVITFEGREKKAGKEFLFSQSGQEIGKMQLTPQGTLQGFVRSAKGFTADNVRTLLDPSKTVTTYSDLWGIKNFAMTRLLKKEEVLNYTSFKEIPDAPLYAELNHTPSFTPPPFTTRFATYMNMPMVSAQKTIIPLQHEHIAKIMHNLYTARFVVKNGYAAPYSISPRDNSYKVALAGVPDGTYEFYYGKAHKIGFGGLSEELPANHPLYEISAERAQLFFNLGIDFHPFLMPKSADHQLFPQRFAFFNEGALHLMNTPVFEKNDPTLQTFLTTENTRQERAPFSIPYIAFRDYGAPLHTDGSYDIEKIQTFGLKIPEKAYYVLGDNYAMSADSRDFGLVPEDNLRGSPAFILWPTQDRAGTLPQPPHCPMTLPNFVIWGLFLFISIGWIIFERVRFKRSLK